MSAPDAIYEILRARMEKALAQRDTLMAAVEQYLDAVDYTGEEDPFALDTLEVSFREVRDEVWGAGE